MISSLFSGLTLPTGTRLSEFLINAFPALSAFGSPPPKGVPHAPQNLLPAIRSVPQLVKNFSIF